jgi:hypothetical protein
LENCTFKPKINTNIVVNHPNDVSIYEKLSKPSLDRERLKVYENVKTIIEMKECTFRPKVNKSSGRDGLRHSKSVCADTFNAIQEHLKDMLANPGENQNYKVNTNVDLFNTSEKGRNNSNQKRKGDGRSPTSGKRFENLFNLHKDKNDKLEK